MAATFSDRWTYIVEFKVITRHWNIYYYLWELNVTSENVRFLYLHWTHLVGEYCVMRPGRTWQFAFNRFLLWTTSFGVSLTENDCVGTIFVQYISHIFSSLNVVQWNSTLYVLVVAKCWNHAFITWVTVYDKCHRYLFKVDILQILISGTKYLYYLKKTETV